MKIKATVHNQELELDIDEKTLAKAGYVKKHENKRWRAEEGESYWSVYRADPIFLFDNRDKHDNYHYNMGNYYQTREEAQKAMDRQLALVRVNDRIMELNKGWVPDWDNEGESKYHVFYSHSNKSFGSESYWTSERTDSVPSMKSQEVAEQIVKECKSDLKVIFGV